MEVSIILILLQSGPLDLHSDWFYKNRRDIIEDRLTWLRSASLEVRNNGSVLHVRIVYVYLLNWSSDPIA